MITIQKNILALFFVSLLLPNRGYNFNYSNNYYLNKEMSSIENGEIGDANFIFPNIDKLSYSAKNIIDNKNFGLYPILGVRYSNTSFELFPEYFQSDLLWITPGVEFSYSKAYSLPFMASPLFQIQSYFRFNKHSAFGFDGQIVDKEQNSLMFPYNPDYSNELYYLARNPKNGIDFDEGEGAVAFITPYADLLLGKFRTRLGPFSSGNLSISNQAPGFPQIQLRTKSDKIKFIFLVGELYSNLFQDMGDFDEGSEEFPTKVRRFIVNHRLDIKIKNNLRIGFYEQVILGHHLPLLYLVPTMPFWSAQHALGDTDNLQMGFDIEYLYKNNRIYGAFLMDEWSPFDTFNSDHHNWFGAQLGMSRLFLDKILMKLEYTRIEPQVYTHDDPINLPYHYDYPIGYWSGGDSEDILVKLFFIINKFTDFTLNFRQTTMGEPIYSYVSTNFLESENLKKRSILGMKLSRLVNSNYGPINCVFELQNLVNDNIYDKDSFINCQFSILYNINN